MKNNTAEVDSDPVHPPLARDLFGNLIALPEGTTAWRICRHTPGRPREITGPDGKAMRFPLALTLEQLVELCGPDTYRVYALDELGKDLGHVSTIEAMREPRNSNEPDVPFGAALRITHPQPATPMTDLRYALETITQIARINGEALRSVSAAQADWVKAIAMAKGLPRNVAYPMLLPPDGDGRDRHDDDDDDEDDEPAPAPAQDPTIQLMTTVAPMVGEALSLWRLKMTGKTTDSASSSVSVSGIAHLAKIQAELDPRERRLLALMLDEGDEAALKDIASCSVDEMVARIRALNADGRPHLRSSEPPYLNAAQLEKHLRKRASALVLKLSPDARTRLMKLAPSLDAKRLADPELLRKLNELVMLDDADAVTWIENNLDEIERMVMS